MVAEPVQATLGALRATYESLSQFVSAQTEKLPDASKIWDSTPLIYLGGAEAGPHNPPPETLLEKIDARVKLRKYELMCVLATGLGVAGVVLHRRSMISRSSGSTKPRRRRTPKLPNGARRDVALVVGSPTEPMTRLLALDFEKRGFIVYLTVFDDKDLKYISSNTITDDINYLDLSGGEDLAAALAKFSQLLQVEVVPIKGAEPHLLKLSAVVFAPNLYFPLGPVENTAAASWDRVLARISVYTRLLNSGLLDLVRVQKSKVIAIVPTIVSSLRLSYHAPETMFQNCLKDLFVTLAKELRPQGISVTQVRLGNLNLTNTRTLPASKSARVSGIAEAEVRSWSPGMQSLYGEQFSKTQTKSNSMGSSIGSQGLRGLHHLLFDLIFYTGRNPSVVYYGSGARSYERISSFLPTALIDMFC
ncbi:hypothetical protein JCM33374_g1943 [Metschnikowia sp. JCM 33374]|nr:hypothetical protein JCM33374_g1943 [Metschnikowia sp. JCM 33374]